MLSIAVFSCHVTLTEFFCSRDDVYTFSQSSRFRPFVFALIIFDLKNILILALPRLLTSRGMFMFIYMASAVARSSSWLAMTWASLPIFFPDVAILKIGSNHLTILSLEVVGSILIILFVCFVVPSQLKSSAFARLYLAGSRLSTRLGIQKEN